MFVKSWDEVDYVSSTRKRESSSYEENNLLVNVSFLQENRFASIWGFASRDGPCLP
ncbi:MAG: hypothetical protein OXM55_05630 [Bdellovibrionales bacterium]|nr:hypothetical protein [Bdellovibrionales bacterium]